MGFWSRRRAAVTGVVGVAVLAVIMGTVSQNGGDDTRAFSQIQIPRAVVREKTGQEPPGLEAARERAKGEREEDLGADGPKEPTGENEILDGPSAQQVAQRAYPRSYVDAKRASASRKAYQQLPETLKPSDFRKSTPKATRVASVASSWSELGPQIGTVPGDVTYTGLETTTSGRVTALVIDPNCAAGDCRLWVAAAGGGIWRTPDALATVPTWEAIDNGLTSNSFGSLVLDPNDPTANTLYAGSGEPNGSGDSEAGVGLFKTTDGGDSWTLVPGSPAVAKDRAIGAIAIDKSDPDVIWIGTAVARHGLASSSGGRRTPPNAPALGIYRSTDGGKYFSLDFSRPGDGVDPASGSDYFTGGVKRLVFDPNDPAQLYASIQGYGIYRVNNPNDGDAGNWYQVFRANYGRDNFPGNPVDPLGALTDFDLAKVGDTTRIYVGDTSDMTLQLYPDPPTWAALFVAEGVGSYSANDLLTAQKNSAAPWQARSSDDITNPAGFSSYNWCQNGQCGYDAFVKVDPNDPDIVYLGGAMNYDEIFYDDQNRSNGRAVIRSTDAGISFTDMTNDTQTPNPLGMHPDQHALVFNPLNTQQVIIGSDGGVVRTSGTFTDASADCESRPDINADDVAFCKVVLAAIPTQIDSLNAGLNTLQFQSLSLNTDKPYTDVIGGTQDNGTWAWDGAGNWFESVGGDGGPSAISADGAGSGQDTRIHTYYYGAGDVNYHGNDTKTWLFNTGPIYNSTENIAFYAPVIADPAVPATYFFGGESVWRTTNNGGSEADLIAKHCSEMDPLNTMGVDCGDWVTISPSLANDPSDNVVSLARAPSDSSTLWVGMRTGGLYISENADAAADSVGFTAIDTASTPGRFVSGIDVDPKDPNHAWISFSGYSAYTPATPGHVFEARYDPSSGTATFTDRSYDLGDQPITGVAFDAPTGDVYASTDFGVARLAAGATSWAKAAEGLPMVATYGLTIAPTDRVLYAATHGRGAYSLALDPVSAIQGPDGGVVDSALQFTSTGSSGFQSTKYLWTFPDGSTSTAQTAGYAATQVGDQVVTLKVTDELGNSTTARKTVAVSAKPAGPLTPTFGSVTRTSDGFTVPITDYNPAYQWAASPSAGKATVSGSGLLTVTGLKPKAASTVTVTTSLPGVAQGSATVTGKAQAQCTLTMKAKSANKNLPKKGATKVVTYAKTAGSCSVAKPKVQTSPLGKGASKVQIDRQKKGALVVTTYKGSKVKVTATYTAESSKKGVNSKTWTRTWRSK